MHVHTHPHARTYTHTHTHMHTYRPEKLEYKEILTPSWREVETKVEKGAVEEAKKKEVQPEAPKEMNGEAGEEKPSGVVLRAVPRPTENHCNPAMGTEDEEVCTRIDKCTCLVCSVACLRTGLHVF